MDTHHQIVVDEKTAGSRLDALCAGIDENLSRKYIKELIANGFVQVDHTHKKPSYNVKEGELIYLCVPEPEAYKVEPEAIPLDIVYEDGDVLVVNKPVGMVVHPAPGTRSGTLVNALLYHTRDLSGINGVLRPGIVHRIDKDTSGLLMVAKNDLAHQSLASQLAAHSITRQYRALVKGRVEPDSGTIDMPIGRHPRDRVRMATVEGGRDAITHFTVERRYKQPYTLMTFRLETGRTHQIRVHMQAIGHPIAGDPLYGGVKGNPFATTGQLLHAEKIGFVHPRTEEYMEFSAPVPAAFQQVLDFLEKGEK